MPAEPPKGLGRIARRRFAVADWLKRYRLLLALILLLILDHQTLTLAGEALLTWDPNGEENLAGYRVYVGLLPGVYGAPIDVGRVTSWTVPNLTAGATYYFAVTAYDTAGNQSGYSNEATKTIPLLTDLIAPLISSITVNNRTLNSATIVWGTDEPSDTRIEYGTTLAYGLSTPLAAAQVTAHSQTLSNLLPGTVYHYRVLSRDAAGNLAISADNTFTTLADSAAPTIPGNVSGAALSTSQINLSWNASTDNVGVTAYRIYRNGVQIGNSTLPTYLDTGLAANTAYSYTVAAVDAAGNLSAPSTALSITTLPLLPVVSQTAASGITSTSAALSGLVNPSGAATTAWFEYGTTTAYGSSTSPVTLSTASPLSANLTGLASGITYHFRLVARNAGGTTFGPNTTFNTPAASVPPSSISITDYTLTQEPYAWVAAPLPLSFSGDDNATPLFLPFPFPFYGQNYQQLYLSTNGLITFGAANTSYSPQPVKNPVPPNAFIAPFWRDLYVGVGQISIASSASEFVIAFNGVRDLCCSTTHTFEVVLRPNGTILLQYGTITLNVPTTVGIESQDGSAGVPVPSVTSNSAFRLTPNAASSSTPTADATPPVISGIGAGSITSSGAAISWSTNEPSDTQVEYGTTTAYGASTAIVATMVTVHSQSLSGLLPATLYHYRVRSRDAAGNLTISGDGSFTTAAAPDTTAPSVPAGLTATAASSSQVNLAWTASTDNIGVSGYRVYRNGTQVATTTLPSYSNSGLTADTLYSFTVSAYDAAGNASTQSTAVSARTLPPPDTTAPVISGMAAGSITTGGALISWSTNEPSDTQVEYGTTTAYGASTSIAATLVTAHSQSLSGLLPSTLYHYRVRSRDAAGNLAVSADGTFTTAAAPDTTAPSVPAGLTATAASSSQMNLAWNSSTDNVGVVGYRVYRNSVQVGTSATPNYSDAGLTAATLYTYRVSAYDAAGNASAQSTTVSAATPAATGGATVSLFPTADTFLNLDTASHNQEIILNTYTWPANRVANAVLMKFNLSGLPAGAVIQSATLNLALVESDTTADATYSVSVHKVINRNPDLARATGYTYDGTNSWTANSCCDSDIPLAQADISTAYDTEAVDKVLGYKNWNVTTLAQEWVSSPASNFGLLINSDTTKGADRYRTFASMEHPTAGLRPSLSITYTTADATAPSVPTGLTAAAVSSSRIDLSWTASTDNIGVSGYRIYRNGVQVGTTPSPSYSNTGLTADALYSFTVSAYDAAGNASAQSAAVSARTLPPADTTAPSVPTGLVATAASSTQINLSWNASSDNVGVSSYRVYRNGIQVGTTTVPSYSNSGLTASTTYSYTVSALDAAGNASAQSTPVSIATPAASSSTTVVISPTADTFLNIDSTVNSAEPTLNTYTWPANKIANAVLMKFNLSNIPAGAIIQSATLNLSLVEADTEAESTYTVSVHKMANKNPDLARATGYTYDGLNAWTPNNCCDSNIPLAQADISSAHDSKAIDKVLGRKSWNITLMVQEWINTPVSNYGLLLNSDPTKGADRYRTFASMEHPTASLRPSLSITYRMP
jgi:chitodextrinase